jgi:pyruvate-formate lyase-activating enzyme
MIAMKLNLDEKQVKEMDPFVRKYVRSHPEWYVTRGAHGGIMKASDKQKKEAAKEAKDLAKKQMQEALEAKVASQNVSRDPSDTE